MVCTIQTIAQTPEIKSTTLVRYGNRTSLVFDAKPARDQGYVLGGADSTFGPATSVQDKQSGGFPVVAKTDSSGKISWQQVFYDGRGAVTSVQQTRDGGYIAAGYQKTDIPYDSSVFVVVRLSADGTVQWKKNLGGSFADRANAVIETSDNGFLAVGSTASANGDVTANHGFADVWVVKLNASGSLLWQKSFGGSNSDEANAVVETPDHGFVVAAYSQSNDGDATANKGQEDGWLINIDGAGVLRWQKNIGGSGADFFKSIAALPSGGYALTGHTRSNDGDVTGNHGFDDLWTVKTDVSGNIIWSKCFGGSNPDFGMNIQRTFNDNTLVAGFSASANGDLATNSGNYDAWLMLLSGTGNIIWQKTVGTPANDYGTAAAFLSETSFVMAGFQDLNTIFTSDSTKGQLIEFGNANVIKGNVFLDLNSNGNRDAGEPGYDGLKINVEKSAVVQSTQSVNGQFIIGAGLGTYNSSFVLSSTSFAVVPATHTSNFTSYFNSDSFDIAVQPLPARPDLAVTLLPYGPARPGFTVKYRLGYSNTGTTTISNGSIKFVKDPRTYFPSAVPGATVVGDTLIWTYATLAPQQSASVDVLLQLLTPPDTKNGDTLHFTGIVGPAAGDVTPADDTFRLKQVITGSFDPNDISEANAGKISRQQLTDGEYLTYLIRFQNTGTDTAFNVTVKDTLESKLDWSSLQMLASSHPYQLTINNGNQLSWLLNDINLADSNRNEPASHGYLTYRIKPKATLADGDVINNTASIYFDYNLPVQTNTELTLLAANTALPVSLIQWHAALAAGKVLLSWTTSYESNIAWYEVQYSTDGKQFTGIGKLAPHNNAGGFSYTLSHTDFIKGNNYYRLATKDADGSVRYSSTLIIYAGADKEITGSFYPNPAKSAITVTLRGALQGDAFISVYDMSGKNLLSFAPGNLSGSSYSTVINLGALSKGVYIIRFKINNSLQQQKLVVE